MHVSNARGVLGGGKRSVIIVLLCFYGNMRLCRTKITVILFFVSFVIFQSSLYVDPCVPCADAIRHRGATTNTSASASWDSAVHDLDAETHSVDRLADTRLLGQFLNNHRVTQDSLSKTLYRVPILVEARARENARESERRDSGDVSNSDLAHQASGNLGGGHRKVGEDRTKYTSWVVTNAGATEAFDIGGALGLEYATFEKNLIFTFYDDPSCPAYFFPEGLYVCGNAKIRGTVVVTSGIDLSLGADARATVQSTGPSSKRADTHCVVHPSEESEIGSGVNSDLVAAGRSSRNRQDDGWKKGGQRREGGLLGRNNTGITGSNSANAEKDAPWCYSEFFVRSGIVYVLNRFEVGGSLIAGSLRVEMGAEVFVGLRGLVYTHPKLVQRSLSAFSDTYATATSELYKRRQPDIVIDNQDEKGEKLSDDTYDFARERFSVDDFLVLEKNREKLFSSEWAPSVSASPWKRSEIPGVVPTPTSFFTPLNSPSGTTPSVDQLALSQEDLMTFQCPVIDAKTGSAVFLRHRRERKNSKKDFVGEDQQEEEQKEAIATVTTHPNTEVTPRQLQSMNSLPSAAARSGAIGSKYGTSQGLGSAFQARPFTNAYHQYRQEHGAATASDRLTRREDFESPFGPLLPPLPHNTTLGNLISLGSVISDRGGYLWVFGNLIAEGVVASRAAHLASHCGQLITNVTEPFPGERARRTGGVTAIEASSIRAGGYLESIVAHIAMQRSSQFLLRGSLIATRYVQVLGSSQFDIKGDMLTALASVTRSSKFKSYGSVEVETLLDVSDASEVSITGILGAGFLQITDASVVSVSPAEQKPERKNFEEVVLVDDTLILDNQSRLTLAGLSLHVFFTVHIANRSTLSIPEGGLYVEEVGIVRIVASEIVLGGNLQSPNSALLIGVGSAVWIGGDVQTSGIMAPVPSEPQVSQSLSVNGNGGLDVSIDETQSGVQNQTDLPTQRHPFSTAMEYKNASFHLNEDELNAGNTTTKKTGENFDDIMPALFIEASEVHIGGFIEVLESWIEITRRSRVVVGNGIKARNPNASLIHLRFHSVLIVERGSVLPGLAAVVDTRSIMEIRNGTLATLNGIHVEKSASLIARNIQTQGDFRVSLKSKAVVEEALVVGGLLLSVDTRSQLYCRGIIAFLLAISKQRNSLLLRWWVSPFLLEVVQEKLHIVLVAAGFIILPDLRHKKGDLFVAHDAVLETSSEGGNIWVYGSIVAQSRGRIHVSNGSLTSVEGDVVAENFAQIRVRGGPLLLFSTYTLSRAETTSTILGVNANETLLTSAFHSPGALRRTEDATIDTERVIPHGLAVEIYHQTVTPVQDRTNGLKRADDQPLYEPSERSSSPDHLQNNAVVSRDEQFDVTATYATKTSEGVSGDTDSVREDTDDVFLDAPSNLKEKDATSFHGLNGGSTAFASENRPREKPHRKNSDLARELHKKIPSSADLLSELPFEDTTATESSLVDSGRKRDDNDKLHPFSTQHTSASPVKTGGGSASFYFDAESDDYPHRHELSSAFQPRSPYYIVKTPLADLAREVSSGFRVSSKKGADKRRHAADTPVMLSSRRRNFFT